MPIPVTARSKPGVFARSIAGIVGLNPAGGMDVCLVIIVCCLLEVTAKGWSLTQRSSTECGVPECDLKPDNEGALAHWGVLRHVKKNTKFCDVYKLRTEWLRT